MHRLEICQCRQRFGNVPSLQVRGPQVIRHIVAQIARQRLRPIQRINGLGVVTIEDVCVSCDEPRQRSSVFFRMSSCV